MEPGVSAVPLEYSIGCVTCTVAGMMGAVVVGFPVLLKIVYLLTCRVLGLAVLMSRGDPAKDAELLVLRHENAVLRRHVGRVRYEPGDRVWFAAVARLLPGRCHLRAVPTEYQVHYNTARLHQGIAQRIPDGEHDGCHITAADLDLDLGPIHRKPVLGARPAAGQPGDPRPGNAAGAGEPGLGIPQGATWSPASGRTRTGRTRTGRDSRRSAPRSPRSSSGSPPRTAAGGT
jgi:hypothetical protein